MAEIRNFRDFDSFKACRIFVKEIGFNLREAQFNSSRILTDQMQRASISVLSNFAEGFEREGNAEFIQFLSISKGSVGELRAQLTYALDQGSISDESFNELDALGESATRLLGGLIRYLKDSNRRGRKYDSRSPDLGSEKVAGRPMNRSARSRKRLTDNR
jgi:four helix bundle protein